jgi:ribosomal protein S27AE
MAKKKGGVKKGKKAPTKTKRVKVSKFYDVVDKKINRKGKDCPKCGVSVKMAEHKTKDQKIRYACGKCGMNVWE